jgi:hypothetical protein
MRCCWSWWLWRPWLAPSCTCGRRNGSNTWEPMPEMRGSPVIVVGFGQEVGLMVRWCLMNSKVFFGGTEVDKINPKIDALYCLLCEPQSPLVTSSYYLGWVESTQKKQRVLANRLEDWAFALMTGVSTHCGQCFAKVPILYIYKNSIK